MIPFSPPTTVTFFDPDVVRLDDDAAADDRTGIADEHLPPRDHERPLVNARLQVDDRRLHGVRRRPRAGEHQRSGKRRGPAETAELTTLLRVAEPRQREARMAEQLRE